MKKCCHVLLWSSSREDHGLTVRIGKTDWICDADAAATTAAEWDFDESSPMLWPDNATAIMSGETVETIGENVYDVLVIEFAGM